MYAVISRATLSVDSGYAIVRMVWSKKSLKGDNMSETNNNTQGEKVKICRSALVSLTLAIILWGCNFAVFAFCSRAEGFLYYFLFTIFIGCLLMSPIFGLVALLTIRYSEGRLKGKGYALTSIVATAIFFILMFVIPILQRLESQVG